MRDRVPFLLYRAAEASHRLANVMLASISLTARQVGILTLVIERGPMTQKALGDDLQVDRTSMTELIDDLEARGLVVRQRNAADRRSFLIHATRQGLQAKEEAIRILDEQQAAFLRPLAAKERRILADLLHRLYAPHDPAAGED